MKPIKEETSDKVKNGQQRGVVTGNEEELLSSLSADLTKIFLPSVVRAQLYREEPKLPRIPAKGAELIGTTSALFLKNLVERCTGNKSSSSSANQTAGNDGKKMSERLIQCADIYKAVVVHTETWAFLEKPLEDHGIQEMIQKEQTHLTEYKPPAKRKRAPTASSRTAKKVLQSVKKPGDLEGPSKSTTDHIIEDEDDYD